MANTQKSNIFGATKHKGFAGYDIVGNIAIVKFSREEKLKDKMKFANKFLKDIKNVSTILEKSNKFSGRLRTQKTKYLLGEKTKEALYKENGCFFRFNVDACYFSPRLASERKEIADVVGKGEKVLVMFGGVAPFAIVIAKLSKATEVYSVEIGRECSKYALENVKRNKLNNVKIIQGDVRKKLKNIDNSGNQYINSQNSLMDNSEKRISINRIIHNKRFKNYFHRIIMARPNLKDSFLDVAFPLIKKGIIHYYGFYPENEKDKLKKLILDEAKKAKKKVKILKIKKAGEIGKKKYRWRVDFRVY